VALQVRAQVKLRTRNVESGFIDDDLGDADRSGARHPVENARPRRTDPSVVALSGHTEATTESIGTQRRVRARFQEEHALRVACLAVRGAVRS